MWKHKREQGRHPSCPQGEASWYNATKKPQTSVYADINTQFEIHTTLFDTREVGFPLSALLSYLPE